MEDYKLDLMIGEGPAARSIRLDLPPFTLVGATTRTGLLTTPLRDRFGIVARLEFYEVAELEAIVLRGARAARPGAAARRRARDRPTRPRHAARRDPAAAPGARLRHRRPARPAGRRRRSPIATLRQLEVDDLGLDSLDRRYLRAIALNYGGGPVGIDTMAAALSEQRDTLEETVEPFLLQQGLLQRTPRGRLLTRSAWQHLGLSAPAPCSAAQDDLFGGDAAVTAARASLPVRVYYEDTDAAGIVYHANYLKFAERGRTELLRASGFDHPQPASSARRRLRGARAASSTSVRPARLDDLLEVAHRGRWPRRRPAGAGAAWSGGEATARPARR